MSLFEQIELQKSSLSGSKLQALEQFLSKGFPTKKMKNINIPSEGNCRKRLQFFCFRASFYQQKTIG
jgi:hypothetical protein